MNKTKGNMYPFIDRTVNFIGGECLHECSYCYVKKSLHKAVRERYSGEIRLFENEFKKSLGKGKFIFVGSCFDMFAKEVPVEWVKKVLEYLREYNQNEYLFQTKNPLGYFIEGMLYPNGSILGTTLESNRDYSDLSHAPMISERVAGMNMLRFHRRMVTTEPILDFDLKKFVNQIKKCEPEWVNIGADSKNNHLPEPPAEKVLKLIEELNKFTVVKQKTNLKRILK